MSRFHVAIVGAGVAGLRCADILLQRGFHVTVIEGRNRVGGRVHQELLPNGHLVDMGANWVHGTIGNPVYELVKQTNSPTRDVTSTSCLFDESGGLMQTHQAGKIMKVMWEMIEEASEYSNKECKEIPTNDSLNDFIKQRLKEKVPDTEDDHAETRKSVMQMSKIWGSFIGSPIQSQSLKYFWLEDGVEGGQSITWPTLNIMC
jgi:phytoene dehydrogenase-like protein